MSISSKALIHLGMIPTPCMCTQMVKLRNLSIAPAMFVLLLLSVLLWVQAEVMFQYNKTFKHGGEWDNAPGYYQRVFSNIMRTFNYYSQLPGCDGSTPKLVQNEWGPMEHYHRNELLATTLARFIFRCQT